MKAIALLLVVLSCQQLLAQHTFEEYQQALPLKLAATKAKLAVLQDKFVKKHGPPRTGKLTREELLQKYANAPTQIPDFEARKQTLAELTKKINTLRAAQPEGEKPGKEFFEEIKKTLMEARNIKMVDVDTTLNSSESTSGQSPVEVTAPLQNVEEFYEEMLRRHYTVQRLHNGALEEIMVSRLRMNSAVSRLFQEMMQDLGFRTESMQYKHDRVRDFIEIEEWIGADEECINAQVVIFEALNRRINADINYCAEYVVYYNNFNYRFFYYPELDFTLLEIRSLQQTILSYFVRANMAHAQQELIDIVDNEVAYGQLRANNRRSVLIWEVNRYVDATRPLISQLNECLRDADEYYTARASEILATMSLCPVPRTKTVAQ